MLMPNSYRFWAVSPSVYFAENIFYVYTCKRQKFEVKVTNFIRWWFTDCKKNLFLSYN